jgi:asparaginyl-tRNA synthetase
MLRVRDTMTRACYTYFRDQGYTNVAMPIITSSDCEGAGEVFTVMHGPSGKEKPFWGDCPSYLTVSGQLHLEALTIGGGLGKAWHLGPCFRAERSDTNRHLNEFWMCEAELAWTENLEDVMGVVEGLVRSIAHQVLQENGSTLKQVMAKGYEQCESITSSTKPWKRITYAEAVKELEQAAKEDGSLFQHSPSYESGLKSEHERFLADKYGPTFVTDYPANQKPFYMRANNPNNNLQEATVACFDLLVPRVGELVGGSLREERLDILTASMKEHGMAVENYEWYLDLRRYGSAPHGGFGLGWERLVSWLCGIENVRECIPFARGAEATRF